MANSTWIETKRDADLDESGRAVVKKVQLEPAWFTGKNKVDLALRIIGLGAIILPIYLVYLQQQATVNTQKAIQQMEAYSETAVQLSSISRRPVESKEFESARDELAYKLPPRIAFLFSSKISKEMEDINQVIPVYRAIGHNVLMLDLFFDNGNPVASSVGSYRNEKVVEFTDSVKNEAHIMILDSCRQELIHWQDSLQECVADSMMTDTAIKALAAKMVSIDVEMLQFCSAFCSYLNAGYNVLKEGHSPADEAYHSVFVSLQERHQQFLKIEPVMKQKYKAILAGIRQALESKIQKMQAQMRDANHAFQD